MDQIQKDFRSLQDFGSLFIHQETVFFFLGARLISCARRPPFRTGYCPCRIGRRCARGRATIPNGAGVRRPPPNGDYSPSFLAWMGWARKATEAMPLNCLAHCCKALTAASRSAVAWTAFLAMVFCTLYNGRMGDCSGRSLIFPSERCFGGHQSYFSRRDDVLAVTGLIFPVGTMFWRSPVLFFQSERCSGGRSLIFPVGTMFWRSEPYFSRRNDVLAVNAETGGFFTF